MLLFRLDLCANSAEKYSNNVNYIAYFINNIIIHVDTGTPGILGAQPCASFLLRGRAANKMTGEKRIGRKHMRKRLLSKRLC